MPKSKSAYSVPGKIGKTERHIIVVWVDNETGVLARIAGLFSGRGYNIESPVSYTHLTLPTNREV